MSAVLFLLVGALGGSAPPASEYRLPMRGLVVGAETWTGGGSELEFRTHFDFVRWI
jgi:hypothetical protein